MKEVKKIIDNELFSAVNIGKLDEVQNYVLVHPKTGQKIEGKVFLKDVTQSTGTEISINVLPPNTSIPYFHIHYQNEETFIIVKGSGDFQVDDQCFPISEGSVIRVAPKGNRSLRNTSNESMTYIVIQSKEGSLEQCSMKDGERKAQDWSK